MAWKWQWKIRKIPFASRLGLQRPGNNCHWRSLLGNSILMQVSVKARRGRQCSEKRLKILSISKLYELINGETVD
jgi:hypothetical protein